MFARLTTLSRSIAGDERGTVAMIFALMAMVLLMSMGLAIDYGRTYHAKSKIMAAADGAALAAGRAMLDGRLSDADVQELGRKFFDENVKSSGNSFANISDVRFSLDRRAGSVTVDIRGDVPMLITRVDGFERINLGVSSAVLSDQRDIELGMALDVTGSMSGSKIVDLRNAAKDLIDILLPSGGSNNKVRIGIAPYSASVNAGSYARFATNNASSNGCVHERGGAEAFTDAVPASGAWLGWKSTLYCPTASVIPLTNDANALKTVVGNLTAGGSTAGHIGAAWADYLISPNWRSVWPSSSEPVAYRDGRTIKAVVLMTDGEFNTWYVGINGDSAVQARALCSNMKSNDVVIYSIAFMSPPDAQSLLRSCASTADHYFNASNGNELRAAFVEIAQHLNNLRLAD